MRVFTFLLTCLFAFSVETSVGKPVPVANGDGSNSVNYLEVTTNVAGEFSDKIDSTIYAIDSLVINGPINSEDFKTMWQASLYGKLSFINLENADVENKTIPDNAFWHSDVQWDQIKGIISELHLKRIILPNDIKTIGYSSFNWNRRLETINIPDSLKSLGEAAFYGCLSLNMDSLIIPEGVDKIPDYCISDCDKLSSKVILPSTVKTIGFSAFNMAPITGIILPEGLDSIGDMAFTGSKIKDITIPSTCKKFGRDIFGSAPILTTLRFAEGTTLIPGITKKCLYLQKVCFPSTTEEIAANAFEGATKIDSLTLPASLTKIGSRAFADMSGLKYIKSEALTPPICDGAGQTNSEYFWGYTRKNIPVYVPQGTKEQYEAALGWNYFTNIQEYGDSDPTGISAIRENAGGSQTYSIYSMNGELVARGTTSGTAIATSLPHGIYVVKMNGKTFKKAF